MPSRRQTALDTTFVLSRFTFFFVHARFKSLVEVTSLAIASVASLTLVNRRLTPTWANFCSPLIVSPAGCHNPATMVVAPVAGASRLQR